MYLQNHVIIFQYFVCNYFVIYLYFLSTCCSAIDITLEHIYRNETMTISALSLLSAEFLQ